MDRVEWQAKFDIAVAASERDPIEASRMLTVLAAESRDAAAQGVLERHEDEALGLAASLLEEAGQIGAASALYDRLVERSRDGVRRTCRLAASTLATAALLHLRSGQTDTGKPLADEAIRLFGLFPEASVLFEKLLTHLRRAGGDDSLRRERPS